MYFLYLSVPTQPSPLPTYPLTLPQLKQNQKVQRTKEREQGDFEPRILQPSPQRGDGAPEVRDPIGAGRGSLRGWGSLTQVRPRWWLPASHHGSGVGVGFTPGVAYSKPTRVEGQERTFCEGFHALFQLSFEITLRYWYQYHSHFIGEETGQKSHYKK